jgi:hypothetical protein
MDREEIEMSKFVEVEWFGRDHTIGIVLTYDEFDGFKCRMAPIPKAFPADNNRNEEQDVKWIMQRGAKIPFEWAWGLFGPRMKTEWTQRHLADKKWDTLRYDRHDYPVKPFDQGKVLALSALNNVLDTCDDNRVTEISTVEAAAKAEIERISKL